MKFKEYQHIARIDTEEVEGLLDGCVHIFPKIDGQNASIWIDKDILHFGSRRAESIKGNSNANFYNIFHEDERFIQFFKKHPNIRLFGEFLTPHQIKYYQKDAWRKFYVFDVVTDVLGLPEDTQLERFNYIPYEDYVGMLEEFGIDYIPLIKKVQNPTIEQLKETLNATTFLTDGEPGEGVVCKNYEYTNKFGRKTWGKMLRDEFKERKNKERTKSSSSDYDEVVNKIVNKYATEAFIQKEYEKLKDDFKCQGIDIEDKSNRYQVIRRLLPQIYSTLLEEEMYNIATSMKGPIINFHTLQKGVEKKTKEVLPQIFH